MVVDQLAPWIIMMLLLLMKASSSIAPIAKPGCLDTCGNISIPYPFGIGPKCYANEAYSVTCKDTRLILNITSLELLNISLGRDFFDERSTVQVPSPIAISDCPNKEDNKVVKLNLTETPFIYSQSYSIFSSMGCDSLATITRNDGVVLGGCLSVCNERNDSLSVQSCIGVKCCQTSIPTSLNFFGMNATRFNLSYQPECKYTFMVDEKWFRNLTDIYTIQGMQTVPAVLEWGTNKNCTSFNVNEITNHSISLCGANAYCDQYGFGRYLSSKSVCACEYGYDGNPYLLGCQDLTSDINECANPKHRRSYRCNKMYIKNIIIGIGSSIGGLLLLVGMWWLRKILKRRKKNKLKQKFFKRNGGLLLQQQLSSGECNVEKTKLFTSKELEKATDYYNQNRILGQGGQGTVFKGMLTDGRIVAIKKSKIMDEGQLEQFINEVVILSQISHRNIVKIFGCCLETEVPLLVYEFIPNGTLFQYIHEENEEFPLSWNKRLQIATEVAGALSYLHSAASIPIYHRDIKSSNILLDEKYRAKVADFGTSRSLAIDQTHLTTRVMGTFGYLDPEYFQSSQFTEKSDVYSFGVVLVELLTGQKAISSTQSEEGRSLATHFILTMKENKLYDIVNSSVLKEGEKHEIVVIANLAKRCLNLNGRKRPTMKELAMELEGISRVSQGASITQTNYEDVEYEVAELTGPWDATSTSTRSYVETGGSLSIDVQPLLLK